MTDLPQSLPQAWRPPMGWNSWDSYGTTLTEDELLANARFMAEHLKNAGWDTLVIDIDWYDPTARAHGYNDNAPLILDEYGRQLPDPVRFPSAAGGKGFGPLAAAVHELGLKLGMHMMRGIPRIAVDKNLPVYGTNYTAKDVAEALSRLAGAEIDKRKVELERDIKDFGTYSAAVKLHAGVTAAFKVKVEEL